MPNNTANKLKFTHFGNTGILNDIESFLDSNDRELDFDKLIPLNGEWTASLANEKWGTKWNSYDVKKIRDENTLVYFFETAWNYPQPILDLIFDKFKGKDVYINFDSACEGGWFALSIAIDSDDPEDITRKEWTSELKNDIDGSIRSAIHSALSI